MKNLKLLFGIVSILLLSLQVQAQRQGGTTLDPNVKGENVVSVKYYDGEFKQMVDKQWGEFDAVGRKIKNHIETNRDEWSVYLYNPQTKQKTALDLWQKRIKYDDDRTHDITLVSNKTEQSITYDGKMFIRFKGDPQKGGDCSGPTNGPFKAHFLPACEIHDYHYNNVPYRKAGIQNGKVIADNIFYDDMCKICDSPEFGGSKIEVAYCKKVAKIWYSFVAETQEGLDAYHRGQNKARNSSEVILTNIINVRNVEKYETLGKDVLRSLDRWARGTDNVLRTTNTSNHKRYTLTFTTASENGAGTDANVNVKIHGTTGATETLVLNSYMGSGFTDAFKQGKQDVIQIETKDIGDIVKVEVGHDNKYFKPNWKLSSLEIKKGEKDYTFDCNCWIKDKTKKTLTPTAPLKDYDIVVKTGTKRGAGTDANVFITINGTEGSTGEIRLTSYLGGDVFESGDTDPAIIPNLKNVGTVTSVRIRHDNRYPGAGWYLEWIRVDGKQFTCNQWLEDDDRDKTLR